MCPILSRFHRYRKKVKVNLGMRFLYRELLSYSQYRGSDRHKGRLGLHVRIVKKSLFFWNINTQAYKIEAITISESF